MSLKSQRRIEWKQIIINGFQGFKPENFGQSYYIFGLLAEVCLFMFSYIFNDSIE